MMTTHGKCGKQFPSNNTHGHCGSCHETFVGITAFDKHWRGENGDRHCVSPEKLNGVWWRDEPGYWHYGPKLDADFHTRVRTPSV